MYPGITVLYTGFYRTPSKFKNGTITPLRCGQYYEIELYTKSSGTILIDGSSYQVAKNFVLLALPGQKRQSIVPFECLCVHFVLDNAQPDILNWAKQTIAPLAGYTPCYDPLRFRALIGEISRSHAATSENTRLYQQAKLLELLSLLQENQSTAARLSDTPYAQHSAQILECKQYLQAHYFEQISLADMAKRANLSPAYFHTVFKAVTGETPAQYLTKIRLNNVRFQLASTDDTLQTIAEACGFSSQPYLNYVFRRAYGVTPNQYRRRHLSMFE